MQQQLTKLNKVLIGIFIFLISTYTCYADNTYSIDFERTSSQYVSITDASQTGLEPAGDFSISFWFKAENDPTADTNVPISKWDATNGYFVRMTNGTIQFFTELSNSRTTKTTDAAHISLADTWYHIVITDDVSAGDIKFYVNGDFKSSSYNNNEGNTTIGGNSTAFTIGYGTVNTTYTDGRVDEVALYNKILTQGDIDDLYNSGEGYQHQGNEDAIISAWNFNNDLLDVTDNDNDLTNNNSATFSTDVPFLDEEEDSGFVATDFEIVNDLSFISSQRKIYNESTGQQTGLEIKKIYVPFFIWLIITLIALFVAERIILELIIRLRK